MSNQLLPCPFCQNPAEEVSGCKGWFSCADEECPAWHIQAKAAAWNRRATQPAAGEPVAWKRPGGNSVICDALKKSPGPEWQTIAESHTVPLYTAPPAAAHGDDAVLWVRCSERLPESGRPVLAFYTNRAGKGRRIRANYVAPKSHEVDCGDPDTQCVEYDEEADCFYLQAGWYELIDNWEEYSSIAVIEGDISHWMPIPAQPAMGAQGDGEVV